MSEIDSGDLFGQFCIHIINFLQLHNIFYDCSVHHPHHCNLHHLPQDINILEEEQIQRLTAHAQTEENELNSSVIFIVFLDQV